MRKTIMLILLIAVMSGCAAGVKTGMVTGNLFTDSREGFSFEKTDDWLFFVPAEKENGDEALRFSLYCLGIPAPPSHSAGGGGWKVTPVYGQPKDPTTGHHVYRFRRTGGGGGASGSTLALAEAHFSIDTTSLYHWQLTELLLAQYKNLRSDSGITLGDLGDGYHLSDEKHEYSDIYFAIKEGKLYMVNFSAAKSGYREYREELEQMLSTISLPD